MAPTLLAPDYIDLQLRLVDAVVRLGVREPDEAVLRYTNLVRRFGLGDPDQAPDNPHWQRYVSTLRGLDSIDERIAWTSTFARSLDPNPPSTAQAISVGPFSVEVVGNLLQTHFRPEHTTDTDTGTGVSPLHPSNRPQRRSELREAVAAARAAHPELRRVRGTSWLYTTESYQSLFPAAHIANARIRSGQDRFQGSSSWGQFLDHRGSVKANLRAQFLAALKTFDGTEAWRLFPVPTMVVDSPIEVFDE